MSELFDTQDDLAEWENMGDGITEQPDTEAAPEDAPSEEAAPEAEDTPATEPEAEPETEPEAEPGAPPDLAALQVQLTQMEARLAEKDLMIGRQSEEVGEVRRLLEQQQAQADRPQVSDWDTLIDDNPARAARIALERGDSYHYKQATEAWEDLSPGAPEVFEQNLRLQQQMTALEQRVTQTTQPLHDQQNLTQVAAAYQQMRDTYPEFEQFEDAMAQTIDTDPLMKEAFTKVLRAGDFDSQYKALESIYLVTAGRQSDTLREAAKTVAREHATETLRAKQEAQVASASASIDTDRPKKAADALGAEWEQMERSRSDGWEISS